jgi:hypothetical protein
MLLAHPCARLQTGRDQLQVGSRGRDLQVAGVEMYEVRRVYAVHMLDRCVHGGESRGTSVSGQVQRWSMDRWMPWMHRQGE